MEQQLELFRVSERIGQLVVEFFDAINLGETFHAEDLHKFIDRRVKSAPGSADRVMRDLRRRGVIGYSVVNRRDSLYVKQ